MPFCSSEELGNSADLLRIVPEMGDRRDVEALAGCELADPVLIELPVEVGSNDGHTASTRKRGERLHICDTSRST